MNRALIEIPRTALVLAMLAVPLMSVRDTDRNIEAQSVGRVAQEQFPLVLENPDGWSISEVEAIAIESDVEQVVTIIPVPGPTDVTVGFACLGRSAPERSDGRG